MTLTIGSSIWTSHRPSKRHHPYHTLRQTYVLKVNIFFRNLSRWLLESIKKNSLNWRSSRFWFMNLFQSLLIYTFPFEISQLILSTRFRRFALALAFLQIFSIYFYLFFCVLCANIQHKVKMTLQTHGL